MNRILDTALKTASLFTLIVVFASTVKGQSADHWPIPTVSFYDCNTSAAATDGSNPDSVLAAASLYVFQALMADSSMRYIDFIKFATVDTGTVPVNLAPVTSLSDTIGIYRGAFALVSTITGSPGNYTFAVYLVDTRSTARVAGDSATFSSATYLDVQTAVSTAMPSILPLIVKIREYFTQLRNSHPGSSINPVIDLEPGEGAVNLGDSVKLSVSVSDCDGTPISNQHLDLAGFNGTFSSTNVQTDGNGTATIKFIVGHSVGVAQVTVSLNNVVTVTGDTVNPSTQSWFLASYGDTSIYWRADFQYSVRQASYWDSISSDVWYQGSQSVSVKASGTLLGFFSPQVVTGTDTVITFFADSTLKITGSAYWHRSHHDAEYGSDCDYTDIASTVYSGRAKKGRFTMSLFEPNDSNYGMQFTLTTGGLDLLDDWYEDCNSNSFNAGASPGVTPANSIGLVKGKFEPSIVRTPSGYTITYEQHGTNGYFVNQQYFTVTIKPFKSVATGISPKVRDVIPAQFFVSQNFPNPFNPTTLIRYQVPTAAHVRLEVYDVLGRLVATLVNSYQTADSYSVVFNAGNLPSGVYFYRLAAGNYTSVKKLMLVK